MLAYAFSVLNKSEYRAVATEDFENAAELCAAILERGVSLQLKRGLGQEYVNRTEARSCLRGTIKVTESVKSQAIWRRQLVCSYDELSVDTTMNRIIKATVALLVRSDISKARKKSLKKLMVFFADVRDIDLHRVDWNMRYDRNNRTYRMLMAVCWLVVKGLLQTQSDGATRMMDFFDEQRDRRLNDAVHCRVDAELVVGAHQLAAPNRLRFHGLSDLDCAAQGGAGLGPVHVLLAEASFELR